MKFRTILADPPWKFEVRTERGRGRSPDMHYDCMTIDAICALPVGAVADENAALLLWATWPTLPQAFLVIEAWGFTYRTGFPWVKMQAQGTPRIGLGYHARACTEPLLIATRGVGSWPGVGNQPVGVLFNGRGAHSAKPEQQYTIAEAYPGPYLELFNRPQAGLFPPREGWTFAGNAVDGKDMFDALKELAL